MAKSTDNKTMDALYRQQFSLGYSQAPQATNTFQFSFATSYGQQVQSGQPLQNYQATLQGMIGSSQQLFGGWQGFASTDYHSQFRPQPGYGASTDYGSHFQPQAGYGASTDYNSFFQPQAGYGASTDYGSFFQPRGGYGASTDYNSFFQPQAGYGASTDYNSQFQPQGGYGASTGYGNQYPFQVSFSPYVRPTTWAPPGPGSYAQPIKPNSYPYSLLPAGYGSAG